MSGLVQAVHALPSRRHWKVTGLWFELKSKVGFGSFDGSDGDESIDVFGRLKSIVQV